MLDTLVNAELFKSRERLVELLAGDTSFKELDVAFREFFVAYELLELALEDYHYDPDEGLEISSECAEELDQVDVSLKAGDKTYSLEDVFKKLTHKAILSRAIRKHSTHHPPFSD